MPKIFTNFSQEDFTFSWDSKLYTVKAGKSEPYPDFLAEHAAKHYTDRELIKAGSQNIVDPGKRGEILSKCLKDVGGISSGSALDEEIAILKMTVDVKDEQVVKPQIDVKEPTSEEKKEETKSEEEKFEGLEK